MEIKNIVAKARAAQKIFEANFNQEQVDEIVKTVAQTVYENASMLSELAVKETGMGVYADKVAKCHGKSMGVYQDLKGKKSMGVLRIDEKTKLVEIAKPIGVVAGITPSTNPVVTPMSKIMFALKTKNAIIIAPHPKAEQCSGLTVELINKALAKFNVPEGLVQILTAPSVEKTQALMAACDVVVATGGMPMVKSAYSSGRPSFGVGAGNVQVILDRGIDFLEAAGKVVKGRTFDNGIICSGEQSFIYHSEDRDEVKGAFMAQGAYFVSDEERDQVVNAIFEKGSLARDAVGQSVEFIAKKAGITVPEGTRVLVLEARGIGAADIVCKEKMCPVLSAFSYLTMDEAIEIATTNLMLEGAGHSAAMHSNNPENIAKAGARLPVSRLIINAPCATTAGGTVEGGLAFTNTLGCGSWGNNSISENFTYKHLLNITRIATISNTKPATAPVAKEMAFA
jgi:succinate-semialdehyde dehydrogenase